MPNDPLARYHFTDDHGHPLENCVEYRELLAENERLLVEDKHAAAEAWNSLPRRHEITPNAVDCAGCPERRYRRR